MSYLMFKQETPFYYNRSDYLVAQTPIVYFDCHSYLTQVNLRILCLEYPRDYLTIRPFCYVLVTALIAALHSFRLESFLVLAAYVTYLTFWMKLFYFYILFSWYTC